MRDPKQIIDQFRTDVQEIDIFSNLLNQFQLQYPNYQKNRRKVNKMDRFMAKPAMATFCLIIGLSIGVGSAFANNEIIDDLPPLDQPASHGEVDKDITKEKSQIMTEPIFIDPSIEQKPVDGSSDGTSDEPIETDSNKVTEKKDHLLKDEQSKKRSSIKVESNNSVKPTLLKNNPSSSLIPKNLPKTEQGGRLPNTASNDLNDVIIGLAISLYAFFYIMIQNKKVNPY